MASHHIYMYRCLELAKLGAGQVAPNPMVGAVLVHDDRVIGEGWHQRYGGPHAEVNCISSVTEKDRPLISRSTLYVSLEPCAHFGKTPPCTDLILHHQVPTVVIACRDPFKQVDGKGIEKLQAGGVAVITGILEKEAMELNRRFFMFHTQHRPYVILKWAQTADGFIAAGPADRLYISNELTNRLVHQWRSEEAAILVGTNTALLDDPELTTRLWPGNNPVRLVVDMELRLPASLKLFNQQARTIVFNTHKHEEAGEVRYYQVTHDVSLVQQVLNAATQLNLQSIIVEGGARLLQSFIDEDCWDEARIITNTGLHNNRGLPAPLFDGAIQPLNDFHLSGDQIRTYRKPA
jgi:diaminohydroxyphosphoribosylaminopyrimidine deaminase / 5-amino-6-(5-phosphoribosylamino)uracil reductase